MQEKSILVTAGARRIGAAICRKLHEQGANLIVHYHSSRNDAMILQADLNQIRPDSVALIQADLLDTAAIPAMVDKATSHFGRLDGLVNNASGFFPTPLDDITEATWHELTGSNLKAPLFLAKAAAAALRIHHGCIVNIIDIHAEWPIRNYIIYSMAKGGLATLTRSLAIELGPDIRVNGVSPGPILWPENGEWKNEVIRQEIIERTLLKRIGTPEDIARTVCFLIADAPYITGQIIAVDGGRSINL